MAEPCPCQRPGVKPTSAYALGCRHPASRRAAASYTKAYKAGLTRPGWLDGTGTRRRLQALAAIGWTSGALGARLGLTDSRVQQLRRSDNPTVERPTQRRIAALYAELADTPGPSQRTRAYAAAQGWAPPTAWDDDEIDNPATLPDLAARPDRAAGRIDPDEVDLLRWYGTTDEEIAARLGVHPDSLTRHDERRRAAARKAS